MLGLTALMFSAAAWFAAPAQAVAGPTVTKQIEQAEAQLKIALKHAEQSLAPHQAGSGWTRTKMQQVLNALQGQKGTDFSVKVENPGDGHGAMNYLKAAKDSPQNDQAGVEVKETLSHTMAYLEEAAEHAKRSIKGTNVGEVHGHARLAAGMLVAALGSPDSASPVTGGLRYAREALTETSMATK
jgi:hypothetical protein